MYVEYTHRLKYNANFKSLKGKNGKLRYNYDIDNCIPLEVDTQCMVIMIYGVRYIFILLSVRMTLKRVGIH